LWLPSLFPGRCDERVARSHGVCDASAPTAKQIEHATLKQIHLLAQKNQRKKEKQRSFRLYL
jgi:hypothetical protein